MSTGAVSDVAVSLDQLRKSVRDFLDAERASGRIEPRCNSWTHFDAAFTRRCGERGFIGLTFPPIYGGRGGSALERYVVCEEILAAGAPVGMHWIADRQSGPQILRHGSEAAKRAILPAVAAGQCCIGIGMSEPGAGSDLAAVRTKAVKVDGGWRITGNKLWTSNAQRADYIIALVRTGEAQPRKHAGLTQVLIDMRAPGVSVHPIDDMSGARDFNEVALTDVFVPDDFVLGTPGQGWALVVGELAQERSGPERFMSSFALLEALRTEIAKAPNLASTIELGRLVAHLTVLRTMSRGIADLIASGQYPDVEAAMVKDLGASFECGIAEVARKVIDKTPEPGSADVYRRHLAEAMLTSPSYTLRGGTRQILRSIIAKHLVQRDMVVETNPVADLASKIFKRQPIAVIGSLDVETWQAFLASGLDQVLAADDAASLSDAVSALEAAGRAAVQIPVSEAMLAGWLAHRAGWPTDGKIATVLAPRQPWSSVPWGRHADCIYFIQKGQIARAMNAIGPLVEGANLAGEPRDTLTPPAEIDVSDVAMGEIQLAARAALLKAALMAGAMQAILTLVLDHARQRIQFDQPLVQFQAIQQMLAEMAALNAAVRAAVQLGAADGSVLTAAIAKVRASEAAVVVADAAHQITGAMGYTAEFPLHRFTRRLKAWRDEDGNEEFWSRIIGEAVLAHSPHGLWPLVSSAEAMGHAAQTMRLG